MSNISPKTTTEPVHNFPMIASLKKKDYKSTTSDPNTNSNYNQPSTVPSSMNMNTYRPPTENTLNQPYSQQIISSKPYIDTKKQQQMYNNEYESEDKIGAAQQTPNTRGYILDMLTNEIRTQIYSHLPDSYSSYSPEVEEYCRKVMFTVEMFFQNQVICYVLISIRRSYSEPIVIIIHIRYSYFLVH